MRNQVIPEAAQHAAAMAPGARAKLQASIDSFFAGHPGGDCDECEGRTNE